MLKMYFFISCDIVKINVSLQYVIEEAFMTSDISLRPSHLVP